ncbi:cupin domain-containing protein [Hymenobacter sp. B81]|uniref:cupin domain-containing protein n=1 Tax=Hymenobacter sp. B81 TaxID=3344878 RepID=UPI0037DDD9AD
MEQQLISAPTSALRAYQGGYLQMLISPEQTGGSFALLDITLPRGSEPPRHRHTREDETFYVLDGRVQFAVGDEVVTGEAGQAVFAPRNVAHHFTILTPQARMLTLITPGEFANYFLEFSSPIAEAPTQLQAPQGPPPAEVLAALLARTAGYGVEFA